MRALSTLLGCVEGKPCTNSFRGRERERKGKKGRPEDGGGLINERERKVEK